MLELDGFQTQIHGGFAGEQEHRIQGSPKFMRQRSQKIILGAVGSRQFIGALVDPRLQFIVGLPERFFGVLTVGDLAFKASG